jgi:uncharacterized damage-inducible protein DinB
VSLVDDHGRPEPPATGDEAAVLLGFLDFQRATLAWKCAGVDAAGLSVTVGASTMTLGGILKHMAYVEEIWFSHWLFGRELGPPWGAVDWAADPDWEWHSAAGDSPGSLRSLWEASVMASRACVAEVLEGGAGSNGEGLGTVAVRVVPGRESPSLRWILVHMVEEYARHNGHADLLREVVDGETGE